MWQPEMVLCSRTTFGKVGQNLATTNLAAISCPVGPNIGCQIWSQTESGCRIWSPGQILGRTIFAMAGLATVYGVGRAIYGVGQGIWTDTDDF